MSRCVITMSRPIAVFSAGTTTYSSPSRPLLTSGVLPFTIFPAKSKMPTENISAVASMMPDPQMPFGSVSPITVYSASKDAGSILTCSIPPCIPRIPNLMPSPSKAGPDAQEHDTSQLLFPKMISPLVPMSTRSDTSSESYMPEAITSPTASPPRNLLTLGRQ